MDPLNSIKTSITSILKCPICYEQFSRHHEPMIIPCGHTICVNCVIQIIKLSEEEYESYSNSEHGNDYESFFESQYSNESYDSSHSSESIAQQDEIESASHESNEEDEEQSEEEDSVCLNLEFDDNLKDFQFDFSINNLDENKKKFHMGEEEKTNSNGNDDGKLIKFKCSLCRKKMKINSKQIIKNIQLAELIKSLDQLHGTNQYLADDSSSFQKDLNLLDKFIRHSDTNDEDSKSISTININENSENQKKEVEERLNKKVFCNVCRNVFLYKDHMKMSNISDFHKQNVMYLDDQFLFDLESTLNIDQEKINELKDYPISNNFQSVLLSTASSSVNLDNSNLYSNKDTKPDEPIGNSKKNTVNIKNIFGNVNKEKFLCKDFLQKKINRIVETDENQNIYSSNERKRFSNRLAEFLISFLNLTINFNLAKYKENTNSIDFNFFDLKQFTNTYMQDQNALSKERLKETFMFDYVNKFIESFSNFKKCKQKCFIELSKIYISFENDLENKSSKNAEDKLSPAEESLCKADKLLSKYFKIFDKLKMNFSLFLNNKVVLQKEKLNYTNFKGNNSKLISIDSGFDNNYCLAENLSNDNKNKRKKDNDKENNKSNYNITSKNFIIQNNKYYENHEFRQRIEYLVKRKSCETFEKYSSTGFFSSILKQITLSEKRYSVWLSNSSYESKSKVYLFDNFLHENVFSLSFNKLILTNEEDSKNGIVSISFADRTAVFTQNLLADEAGLNIYFLGSGAGNSKNFRAYNLAKKHLIELEEIPEKFYVTDTIYHQNKIFIIGGNNVKEQAILSCYFYDIHLKKWANMPKLNIHRFKKCLFINKNCIYAYGGQQGYVSNTLISDNNNNNILSTQLWKFEVFHLENLYSQNQNSEVSWKVLEIKGFNNKLYEFGYGLINTDKFILLGGIQEDDLYYEQKGFIIDLKDNKIFENLKTNYEIDNQLRSSNFFRGAFHILLDEEEEKVIKYDTIFANLNVLI